MLHRDDWLPLARKLDWDYTYASEKELFPEALSGSPWLPKEAWKDWDEPYRTSFAEYAATQHDKEAAVRSVRDAVGKIEDFQKLPASWINALKFHCAILPLAEFAATIGNLRAGRFARDSAWRSMATLGAMDETRHTQIPLAIMHELVRWDRHFDWTHKFYHTNNWVAIASRHFFDEILLGANPIEFALATNFVFETGFTNLQFVGLSSLAHSVGDKMFEKMQNSIQTDEARHAQIGPPVLEVIVKHDKEYAQYVLDKVFWRSWLLISILTGFTMDYLTPLNQRTSSFKEFMEEWMLDQYLKSLKQYGLKKPWYWDTFLESMENYHHMVYASAYTHRATVWFNMAAPGPEEREWLAKKYPKTWHQFDPVWERVAQRWGQSDPDVEWNTHGATPVAFCDMCQIVLSGGTPDKNTACTLEYQGRPYIFCSQPCRWIFEKEPQRYASHKSVVGRILAGEAPPNLVSLVRNYFGLEQELWGKDVFGGRYPWIKRKEEKV